MADPQKNDFGFVSDDDNFGFVEESQPTDASVRVVENPLAGRHGPNPTVGRTVGPEQAFVAGAADTLTFGMLPKIAERVRSIVKGETPEEARAVVAGTRGAIAEQQPGMETLGRLAGAAVPVPGVSALAAEKIGGAIGGVARAMGRMTPAQARMLTVPAAGIGGAVASPGMVGPLAGAAYGVKKGYDFGPKFAQWVNAVGDYVSQPMMYRAQRAGEAVTQTAVNPALRSAVTGVAHKFQQNPTEGAAYHQVMMANNPEYREAYRNYSSKGDK